MIENSPDNTSNDEPDIIDIEKERRESWYNLKDNNELIERLEKLLDEALSGTDLENTNISEIRGKINHTFININRFPQLIFINIERNNEGKITEIICTTHKPNKSKSIKPKEIKFSKTI